METIPFVIDKLREELPSGRAATIHENFKRMTMQFASQPKI